MTLPIYLDHHATTPVDPAVLEVMLPYFGVHFGNAASRTHAFGWRAEEAVEKARGQVATLLGATAREIIFTSGATEANHLALFGVADAYGASDPVHIVTQATEHKAILDVCAALEARGHRVTVLDTDAQGRVTPEAVEAALEEDTALVSLMAVNNEIGTCHDLQAVGKICAARGVLLHTDATQAAAVMPMDVVRWGAGLVSVSAHKMYGPKGVGALYVSRKNPRVTLTPQAVGGGQERGLRSGTLNVPGIVGLGAAAALAVEKLPEVAALAARRDRLQAAICGALTGVVRYGDPERCHPGNLNLGFDNVDGETLVLALHGLAVSTGSACTSRDLAPSHVLRALGLDDRAARGNIRFGLGRGTTDEAIEVASAAVIAAVEKLRKLRR